MTENEILKGVIDIHIHGFPEISLKVPNAAYDHLWIPEAAALGMRAVCLKSHYWPTVDKVYTLNNIFPDIDVYGGIVLNSTVGGFNRFSIQVAIENGAKIIWFPTFSAANDINKGGYSRRVISFYGETFFPALHILDAKGNLLSEVRDILKLIAVEDVALATGHLSVTESKILINAAREYGIQRIIFTHALNSIIGASLQDQAEIAAMGAFIEHCFVATMPMHQQLSPAEIVSSIKSIGADKCIISSDAVFAWNPTPPQMMRMFIITLLEAGITQSEIKQMSASNPAYILGL